MGCLHLFFKDARGYFYESWNQKAFKDAGSDYSWVQDNQSKPAYDTVRGIHYQKGDDAQDKLARVLQGKVLDIVVHLRKGSLTFGQHVVVELTENNHRQLFIPRGFGHGFSVLSETAVFTCKCGNGDAPQSGGSVNYADRTLNIDWWVGGDRVLLSRKDAKAQNFEQYIRLLILSINPRLKEVAVA